MKTKYLIFGIFILLLAGIASAHTTSTIFNVSIVDTPQWFVIYATPGVIIQPYGLNSSVDYAATSWKLYGTNTNSAPYILLDNQTDIAFAANVEQFFYITCPGNYSYYYLEFRSGFTDPSAFMLINITSDVPIYPVIYSVKKPPADLYRKDTLVKGIVGATGILFVCAVIVSTKRKK